MSVNTLTCDLSRNNLISCLRKSETVSLTFLKRWKNEYLKSNVVAGVQSGGAELSEGDVVLIDDEHKREYWPMARIVKLIVGRDNKVRSVIVRLKGKLIRRGINRVYALEVSDSLNSFP